MTNTNMSLSKVSQKSGHCGSKLRIGSRSSRRRNRLVKNIDLSRRGFHKTTFIRILMMRSIVVWLVTRIGESRKVYGKSQLDKVVRTKEALSSSLQAHRITILRVILTIWAAQVSPNFPWTKVDVRSARSPASVVAEYTIVDILWSFTYLNSPL